MAQPWAWHKLQCCCEEGASCDQYVECCVNGVSAIWAIRDKQNELSGYTRQGITVTAKLKNLCTGATGPDWSSWLSLEGQYFKEPATTRPQLLETSGFQSSDGCVAGINVDPRDIVCPCQSGSEGNFNFCLEVTVASCFLTTPTTWYLDVAASQLNFSLGFFNPKNPPDDIYTCKLPVAGYSIDGGAINTTWSDGLWEPFTVQDEDTPVVIKLYFRHNPECVTCIDQTLSAVVADINQTSVVTPEKECFKLACIRNTTGFSSPFIPELFDSCNDCKPTGGITDVDERTYICLNCLWSVAWAANENNPELVYPTDALCKCGCAGCTEERITAGPDKCIPPSVLGSPAGNSESGETKVCVDENLAGKVIWHGFVGDGCTPTSHEFSLTDYTGPYGSVSSLDPANHPGGRTLNNLQDEGVLDGCEKVTMSWNNVQNGTLGGFPCYDVSMTIGTDTWTKNNCPLGEEDIGLPILFKRDHGC